MAAIEKACLRAKAVGVDVNFVVDDLTNIGRVRVRYDFLLDYGMLDDLRPPQRELYLQNILPLTHPGSRWSFS